ncbi:TFIIB-type zinc ribbon-containing protein [Bosea sp. ASV33]|uniref:TFIIB-type zinc ribbon-containing protein n=1 Tax=Bosea sp. ASV33 TaxID=2795106 RepID=UPI0018ED514C|nr:TFIIB-type zinc ribbon-containing protein [Bosea sp. ASV33]
MTTTNDAPAPAIRCTYCGDTRTITDRVDGEITCPECGYDAPAPAPSGSGGRVKPLEWQPTSSGFCWHAASAVGRYFIEERHSDFRWNVEGWPGEWAVNTLDEAKAAAQADYEARIRSALANDASPRGEAVVWQWRMKNPVDGSMSEWRDGKHGFSAAVAERFGAEERPLYAHPAPATVEMREALDWHDGFHAFRAGPCVQDLHTAFVSGWMYRAEQEAALAPATEGR